MWVGPIFSREALASPRQLRHFVMRSGYVFGLFVLMYTLAQVTFGWQHERHLGDLARFGSLLFQVFSLLQLTLVLFFALLFAAGNVAQEKDRKTLVLLLMTDLRNRELVLGKLFASLLIVGVLLAASLPVFTFLLFLGGVSVDQIGWSLAITAAAALAAGSWGSLVAFWKEKTFQTLAYSVIGLVLFLGIAEGLVGVFGTASPVAQVAMLFDPFRGMLLVLEPLGLAAAPRDLSNSPLSYVVALFGLALVSSGVAIGRLRIWNPSDADWNPVKVAKEAAEQIKAVTRAVWRNPVIWREICTSAYGRRVFVIKLAYLALFAFAFAYAIRGGGPDGALLLGMISPPGLAFAGLSLLSLLLVNAQSVTSLTTERDAKTLELLLVTDITSYEFIFGKLGGVFYNTKEVLILPLAVPVYYVFQGTLSLENFCYILLGFVSLVVFSATLGLHAGLAYENSRAAIANSLGTMFFLFLGIFICMMLILEGRSSFWLQLPSFLVFILGGSLGLSASLTHKNPSPALTLAAFILPFATFHALTGFLLHETLGVCLVIISSYGFTTAAMLILAVSEFDSALGRTVLQSG